MLFSSLRSAADQKSTSQRPFRSSRLTAPLTLVSACGALTAALGAPGCQKYITCDDVDYCETGGMAGEGNESGGEPGSGGTGSGAMGPGAKESGGAEGSGGKASGSGGKAGGSGGKGPSDGGGPGVTGGAGPAGGSDGMAGAGGGASCGANQDRECTEECPCEMGEGSCAGNDQCAPGLICSDITVAKLGTEGASCIPAHCDNDVQDEEETSVDCGGGCGCRATFEIVQFSGDFTAGEAVQINDISADGTRLAVGFWEPVGFSVVRPGLMTADGHITELERYGVPGTGAMAISADGLVLGGGLSCTLPPDCETLVGAPYIWSADGGEPTKLGTDAMIGGLSQSGAVAAGSTTISQAGVVRYSSGQELISELVSFWAMSADGIAIVGPTESDWSKVGLWRVGQGLVEIPDLRPEWRSIQLTALSGDGSIVLGNVLHQEGWSEGAHSFVREIGGPESAQIDVKKLYQSDVRLELLDLSADGNRAVGTAFRDSPNVDQAVVWDRSRGLLTIAEELARRGFELAPDQEIRNAHLISDDGTAIVGRLLPTGFWYVRLSD